MHSNDTADIAEFDVASDREHIRLKSMYLGKRSILPVNEWLWADNKFTYGSTLRCQAIDKCIEEIISNAIDNYDRAFERKSKTPVTAIDVAFNRDTGVIRVTNNGDGIPIVRSPKYNDMYIPDGIFSMARCGSNIHKDANSTLGGTNGYGAKLTIFMSTSAEVNTTDGVRKLTFAKKFADGLSVGDPVVGPTTGPAGTQVAFKLDWSLFTQHELPAEYTPELSAGIDAFIVRWLKFLAYMVKLDGRGCNITYNGGNMYDADLFAKFGGEALYIVQKSAGTTWTYVVSLVAPQYKIGIINGVYVRGEITTVERMLAAIKRHLRATIKSTFGKELSSLQLDALLLNISICFIGRVRGVEWNAQNKDTAGIPESEIARFGEITDKQLAQVWKLLEPLIADMLETKNTRAPKYDKYEAAQRVRIDPSRCLLLIVEGKSAAGATRDGLKNKIFQKRFGSLVPYIGLFQLKGVPINAGRNVKQIKVGTRHVIKQTDKLKNNVEVNGLLSALGIEVGRRYDNSEEGLANRAKLNYGRAVLLTDQDIDATNIQSLTINNIRSLCTGLVESDSFFSVVYTALVRVYLTKEIHEFYTEDAFRQWCLQNPRALVGAKKDAVKYVKGLASNNGAERIKICMNIFDRCYRMHGDWNEFDKFLGDDPAVRRALVNSPIVVFDCENTRDIDVYTHLHGGQKAFMCENLERKLPSPFDGLVPSRRKSVAVAKTLKSRPYGVDVICGEALRNFEYHHGAASLISTLNKMSQVFIGANNIPYYLPEGQSGTSDAGGADSGQSRYVKLMPNLPVLSAMFPSADADLLEYVLSDGVEVEPHNYLPILPPILETRITVAHGWNCAIYARDLKSVVRAVRDKLAGIDITGRVLPFWSRGGENVQIINGGEYSLGEFHIETRRGREWMVITKLPYRCWRQPYLSFLKKIQKGDKAEVQEIKRKASKQSGVGTVRPIVFDNIENAPFEDAIHVRLKANYRDILAAMYKAEPDDVIKLRTYFQLYTDMRPTLNFYHNGVINYTMYSDIITDWFVQRRGLYVKRLERERELLQCRIAELREVVRYCEEYHTMQNDMQNISDADDIAILRQKKFTPLNVAVITSHRGMLAADIRAAFTGAAASYDYLRNMRRRDLVREQNLKRRGELAELERESATYAADVSPLVATVWLREIKVLLREVKKGIAMEWKTPHDKKLYDQLLAL